MNTKTPSPTSVFSDFTNKYALSKTLRFELRPVGNTQKMLEDENVFEKDRLIQQKYEKTKPYFDRFHRAFISKSLSKEKIAAAGIVFDDYFTALQVFQANKKDKKLKEALEGKKNKGGGMSGGIAGNLRKKINGLFGDTKFLFSESIFDVLDKDYGKEKDALITIKELDDEKKEIEKEISIFADWKGFRGYFSKFHETRKNLYKDDGTFTAIATRVIDQNLRRFCENIIIFEKVSGKIDFSEVEKNFKVNLKDVFTPSYYGGCLLQDGIDTYNEMIGGKTLESGEKQRGINELINKYRQDNKGEKLPFLKVLDKQILSEKESIFEEIESNADLLGELRGFFAAAEAKTNVFRNLINDLADNSAEYTQDDMKSIYLSKEALNTISHRWTSQTERFESLVYGAMKGDYKRDSSLKFDEEENTYSFPDFIALLYIQSALQSAGKERLWKDRYYAADTKDVPNPGPLSSDEPSWEQFLQILKFEVRLLFKRTVEDTETGKSSEVGYDVFKKSFIDMLNGENLSINPESKATIKDFADAALYIYQMGKYFALEKKRNWVDGYDMSERFYKTPDTGYLVFYKEAYEQIVKKYNLIRNYLTKKPYEENKKWKLNFENAELADGFDRDKEKDNLTIILRKDGKYYLGIMKKGGANHIFSKKALVEIQSKNSSKSVYEKLDYKQIANPSFDIHNLALVDGKAMRFTKMENKERYWPIEILRIKQEKSYAQENFKREDFVTFVEYMKRCAESYWGDDFELKFRPTSQYRTIKDFTDDLEKCGYIINFETHIPVSYIEAKNQAGELYLFEIHNKDWNLKDGKVKNGTKNMHTLYFEEMFSKENANAGPLKFPFKLNGGAELFFRRATDVGKLGYKKNSVGQILKNNKGENIVDRYRFSKDKVIFHCSVTINRCANDEYNFNSKINDLLAHHDINVVGIDRGEKHLAYYTVLSPDKHILDTGSLNYIERRDEQGLVLRNGKKIVEVKNSSGEVVDYRLEETNIKTDSEDYKLLLEYREKKRRAGRQTWNDIEGIKELKAGYISQVVRKLVDLAIKYDAIIVLEDLNMRFKQIRGGIERSVYQQLEKALIEKLRFLVEKGQKDPAKAGHLLRAYQLVAKDASTDAGKQTGIIFYTQANYTSVTDPITGFRKNVYISNTASKEKINNELKKFRVIAWDDKEQSYFFRYNPVDFVEEAQKDQVFSKEWTVYAKVPRLRRERIKGQWEVKKFDPNESLIELLKLWKFEQGDVLSQINAREGELMDAESREFDGKKRSFHHSIVFIFNMIMQLRNSGKSSSGEEIDYIASPVSPFFSTEPSKMKLAGLETMYEGENVKDFAESYNGDANGARNIAAKGLILLERIKSHSQQMSEFLRKHNLVESDLKELEKDGVVEIDGDKIARYPNLFISNKDWDEWASSQE